MKLLSTTLTLLIGLGASHAAADDVQRHDFERSDAAAAWSAFDARVCSATSPGRGGNPGGFLDLDCKAPTLVGVRAPHEALVRDLAGKRWSIGFDLTQLAGAPVGVFELVLRGPRGSWSYTRSWDEAPPASWRSYRIAFDPSWSDGQAILHGWYANPLSWAADADQDSFVETLRDVRDVSLYFVNEQGPLQVGLDNFELRREP